MLKIKTNCFNIISGHCLAFYAFQKDIFDYIDIYQKLDDKFINTYPNNNKTIICGDFNYENIRDLLISTETDFINKNIITTWFDHKLSIFEIK